MDITLHISSFGQMFGVPNVIVDHYLKLATPSQLKTLLFVLRHSDQSLSGADIAKAIGVTPEQVEEALEFWQQTDLFSAPQPEQPVPEKPKPALRPMPRPSKSEELSPKEIAAELEKSDDLKYLFEAAEKELGRPLRHIEQKSLLWLHDYHDIGSDVILTVLTYCRSIDRGSMSYVEALLLGWQDDGLTTLEQVTAALHQMEYRRSFTGQIRSAFEMQRSPTPKQQSYIDAWQDMELPMELITYAYEKTVENTDKLSFPYLDKLLTRWSAAGYKTRKDVDEKDLPPKKKQAAEKSPYASLVYNDFDE